MKNISRKLFLLQLALVTLLLLTVPAFSATYDYSVSGASSCTAKVGDTLNLSNPQSASEMDLYNYSWSWTGPEGCITLNDYARKATVKINKAGTVKICAKLYGSIPVVNKGVQYNPATKEYESYEYITYVSREYKSYLVVTIYDDKPPTIEALPDTVTAAEGKKATVTVDADTNTGTSLQYQWYYANKGSNKFLKASITSATYSVTMNDTRDGRKVYCVVTDGNGKSTKSETVILQQAAPIKIKTQPANVTVTAGATAQTTVKATGEGELKYQWYIKNPGSSSFGKSSVTSKTYSIKMKPSLNGRKAYCVISDAYGQTVKTKTVTLKMNNKLGIYSQPSNDKAVAGDAVSVTVKANGTGTLKYQWYIKNPGSSKFSKSSVQKATYSVKMSAKINGRQAYCVITDSTGAKVTSKTVTLSVVPTLKISAQPQDAVAAMDGTAKATVSVSGGSGVKYQWYVKNPGSNSFVKSSITKSTYSVKMKESIEGRQLYCVVTDNYGQKVVSDTVTVRVAAKIAIWQQPTSAWQSAGKRVSVSVFAYGEGKLNYQWYIKNAGQSTFSKSSVTSSVYSITMSEKTDGRQLYCVITDSFGQRRVTDVVKLTNADPIVITAHPQDSGYRKDFTVSFENTGHIYKIEWYARKSGEEYELVKTDYDATESSCNLTNLYGAFDAQFYANGNIYCVITDNTGQRVESNAALIGG